MKIFIALSLIAFALAACAPVIKMQAPDKPLEINMNVKIEHQIKIQVDKQLDNVMDKNEDIF